MYGPRCTSRDLTQLVFFTVFGFVCACALVLGGIGWAIWFAINHVRIV